jgi:hypothetical protein
MSFLVHLSKESSRHTEPQKRADIVQVFALRLDAVTEVSATQSWTFPVRR